MNSRTKAILQRSLVDFNEMSQDKKEEMVNIVLSQLERNKKGIDNIGMGLDEDMVQAGKIFIRINRKYIPLPF